MKKLKTIIGLSLMYLGAWIQGYKYILILGIVLVTILEGCSVGKYGCPSENQSVLNKAANRPFNK